MKKIAIKYGLFMLVGFIAFFLIMHVLGHSMNYNLRIFNGVIHIGLIALAIREYRQTHPESLSNYISGVAMGMYASVIGVLGFTIFMGFYLLGDEALLSHIQASIPIGDYITPFTASLFIVVEGIAVSLIGSYIVTRIIDMRMAKDEAWERYRR